MDWVCPYRAAVEQSHTTRCIYITARVDAVTRDSTMARLHASQLTETANKDC